MIFFVSLWDTGADAEIRKSIYSRADAVMICFSVDHDEETIREVLKEFVNESMNVSKNIFLVGTKTELRSKKGNQIQYKKGKELAKELRLQGYFECSAQSDHGSVSDVFKGVAKKASEEKDLLAAIRLFFNLHLCTTNKNIEN